MANEIRTGQLIAPFGVGSIYTDKTGTPNIICGLDYWFSGREGVASDPNVTNRYIIDEPRLSELLDVPFFRQPPQYVNDTKSPLYGLTVQTHRFPKWYYDSRSGKLKKFNLDTLKCSSPNQEQWRPVRFISVCSKGHISDFPWKQWCGCICPNDEYLTLHDTGGPDLGAVIVSCSGCKSRKSLAGAMTLNKNKKTNRIERSGLANVGISPCQGERPWLGDADEECDELPVAVLINQSNIYFGKVISSIYLPNLNGEKQIIDIQNALTGYDTELTFAKMCFEFGQDAVAVEKLKKFILDKLSFLPDSKIIKEAILNQGKAKVIINEIDAPALEESKELEFRRAEYNILRNEVPLGTSEELRVSIGVVPKEFQDWLNRVNLVERLRETRVFYGFERLIRSDNPRADMPNSALSQLFKKIPEQKWLPAVKNFGEGIYLELKEEAIANWLEVNSTWLQERLDGDFVGRLAAEGMLFPPIDHLNQNWKWAARYLLIHTFAHILINQLVFESGYSSASLKERIFISNDPVAPMAAFLIYTASGDSEGSLGGLVRLGRPELFETMVKRAITKASWCSADPVCSEDLGGTGSRLVNKAACHACVLLPETACETINSGLDRAILVGLPSDQSLGFFSNLID